MWTRSAAIAVLGLTSLAHTAVAETCGAQTGATTTPIACPAGTHKKKPAYATITCDFDTSASQCRTECCDATCKSFACTASSQHKAGAENVACSSIPQSTITGGSGACNAEFCCDTTPVSPLQQRGTLRHTLEWCADNTDCQKAGDAASTCPANGGDCTCSANHAHLSFYKLCFASTQEVVYTARFNAATGGAACTGTGLGALPTADAKALNKIFAAVSKGDISDGAYFCINSRVEVVLIFDVDVPKVTAALAVTAANIQAAVTADTTLSAAFKNMIGGGGVGDLTVAKVVSPCTGGAIPTQAAIHALSSSGQCLTVKCNNGFKKPTGARGGACTAADATTPACISSGDCSWRGALPICNEATNACVAAPVLSRRKVRAVTSFVKHWCTEDSHCRLAGDSAATCNLDAGLGNWCQCGSGFAYPGTYLATCLAAGAAHTTVKLGYNLQFPTSATLSCPPTAAQLTAVSLLVQDTFAVPNATAQAFCSAVSTVTFLGTLDMPLARANTLSNLGASASTVLADIVAKYNAASASRAADVLVNAKYAALGTTAPSAASVGSATQCSAPLATATGKDQNGVCRALSCVASATLQSGACVGSSTVTPIPATAVPGVVFGTPNTSTDDELNTQQIVAITLGAVAGLCAIAFVVLTIVKSGKTKKEEDTEMGPSEQPASV